MRNEIITVKEPVFVDTWAWLALGHRRDSFHDKVERIFQQVQADNIPLYSSEYILDELITLLFRRENYSESVRFIDNIFNSVLNNELVLEKISEERFQKAWQLRIRLRDKPLISFTDIISMVIMRDLSIRYVITDDEHFTHLGFIKIPYL